MYEDFYLATNDVFDGYSVARKLDFSGENPYRFLAYQKMGWASLP